MTRDRKEYWRQYARNRKAQLQIELWGERAATKWEELAARYQAECVALGGLEDHKHWRKRKEIREKLCAELGLPSHHAQAQIIKLSGKETKDARIRTFMWIRTRNSARQRGIRFAIQKTDIILVDTCPILGLEIDYTNKDPARKPSLDRLDNSRGYEKDNIHVISLRANILKRDATPDELIALGAWAETLLT